MKRDFASTLATPEQLEHRIQLSKNVDGTNNNSTLATPEQLIKITEEDNELLPKSKKQIITSIQMGIIETIEQLEDRIQLSKNVDGRL